MNYEEIKATQAETKEILTELEKRQETRSNKINDLLASEQDEEDFEL